MIGWIILSTHLNLHCFLLLYLVRAVHLHSFFHLAGDPSASQHVVLPYWLSHVSLGRVWFILWQIHVLPTNYIVGGSRRPVLSIEWRRQHSKFRYTDAICSVKGGCSTGIQDPRGMDADGDSGLHLSCSIIEVILAPRCNSLMPLYQWYLWRLLKERHNSNVKGRTCSQLVLDYHLSMKHLSFSAVSKLPCSMFYIILR